MNNQIASDMLELADICKGDKKLFADVAEFIVNRILFDKSKGGYQKLRTQDELKPYMFQLIQTGNQLQPLSREDAYQACLPHSNNPYLIDKLLGRDGGNSDCDTIKLLQRCLKSRKPHKAKTNH